MARVGPCPPSLRRRSNATRSPIEARTTASWFRMLKLEVQHSMARSARHRRCCNRVQFRGASVQVGPPSLRLQSRPSAAFLQVHEPPSNSNAIRPSQRLGAGGRFRGRDGAARQVSARRTTPDPGHVLYRSSTRNGFGDPGLGTFLVGASTRPEGAGKIERWWSRGEGKGGGPFLFGAMVKEGSVVTTILVLIPSGFVFRKGDSPLTIL
jgi:hypothetical protein